MGLYTVVPNNLQGGNFLRGEKSTYPKSSSCESILFTQGYK